MGVRGPEEIIIFLESSDDQLSNDVQQLILESILLNDHFVLFLMKNVPFHTLGIMCNNMILANRVGPWCPKIIIDSTWLYSLYFHLIQSNKPSFI